MKRQVLMHLAGYVLAIATFVGFVAAGGLDFSADEPHWPLTEVLIAWSREASINRRASAIVLPGDLASRERVRRGAGNYDAMCVSCHLAPGVGESELSRALYPAPPKLTRAPRGGDVDQENRRRFWIIKHGIKASGMPAWSRVDVDDEAIWDLVALIAQLPAMSPDDYRHWVGASDGHHHGEARSPAAMESKPDHPHKPGTKPHAHPR